MDFETITQKSRRIPRPPPVKPLLPPIRTEMFSSELNADLYARFALACYEESYPADDEKYHIKETLGACRRLIRVPEVEAGVLDWCHVSYIVQDRRNECFFFFAELYDVGVGTLSLARHFRTMTDYSKLIRDCGFCTSECQYLHPPKNQLMFGSEPIPHDEKLLECFELRLKELKGEKPNRDYAPPQLLDHQAAELVLEYIKKKELVDFQLVGTNGSYRCQKSYSKWFRKDVQWAHVSFTAKPRPENGDDGCNDDASEKLIFAEMFDYGQGVYFVQTYSVLDPHDSKITQGCSRCPSDGHHPHPSIGEYFFGFGESDTTDNLRP